VAKKEWLVSLFLLLLGVACSVEALRLGLGTVRRPGVGFLPLLVGGCLSLLAFFSLIIDIWAAIKDKTRGTFFVGSIGNVVVVVCCLGVYVVVLPFAGYLLSTFVLFIFLFRTGGFKGWGAAILAAFLTASISYLLFGFLLNIRFPKGFPGL
jgi:putative tricarboxylic transport membrane protein